jgi:F-type H+-transporting ATPase subunit a
LSEVIVEEHPLWFTVIVNRVLGKPAAAILSALHIRPASSQYPIPNHLAMEILVFLLAVVFFLWLRSRISVDRPGATQQCMEILIRNPLGLGIEDMLHDFVGHGGERYMPMLGSIGLFVLFCNLLSLIPTLESPTATDSVPLGCAILVFIFYHVSGVRRHGVGAYLAHFTGPEVPLPIPFNWLIKGIVVVIEGFSHFARLLSLTARLWANMFVSELLYVTFLTLTLMLALFAGHANPVWYTLGFLPLLGPVLFILLHIFVGFVQAFVFTILPIIYVGGAVAEEH